MAFVMVRTLLGWWGHLLLLVHPFLNQDRGDNLVFSKREVMGMQNSPYPFQSCCCELFPKPLGITGLLELQRKHLPLLRD